jgi:hypothetical protein
LWGGGSVTHMHVVGGVFLIFVLDQQNLNLA